MTTKPAKRMTALQRARNRVAVLETALQNAVEDSAAHALAAQSAKDAVPAVVVTGPVKTFPDDPTWEQKCRASWGEVKRLEAERLANAKQIHDFNCRLGINDTNAVIIERNRVRINELLHEVGDAKLREAKADKQLADAQALANALARKLEAADDRIASMVEANERDREDGDVRDDIDVDVEIEALTEVIRAAKAIRRRWRA